MSGASDSIPGPSTDNFTSIFNAEYERLTRKRLDTHPLVAVQLHTYQNPRPFRTFFERKHRLSVNFVKGDERLMSWSNPTIHILYMFSSTLIGEGIGLYFVITKYSWTHRDYQPWGRHSCRSAHNAGYLIHGYILRIVNAEKVMV